MSSVKKPGKCRSTRSDAEASSSEHDSCDALRSVVSTCSVDVLSNLAYGDGNNSFEHNRQ